MSVSNETCFVKPSPFYAMSFDHSILHTQYQTMIICLIKLLSFVHVLMTIVGSFLFVFRCLSFFPFSDILFCYLCNEFYPPSILLQKHVYCLFCCSGSLLSLLCQLSFKEFAQCLFCVALRGFHQPLKVIKSHCFISAAQG